MDSIFNISGYLFFILLSAKIIIHIYLDSANGYKLIVSPVSGWVYLMPYAKTVSTEFEKKKKLCNFFQMLSMYLLFFTILVLLMKIYLNHL